MIAKSNRKRINPPSLYELTGSMAHNGSNTTAIVPSRRNPPSGRPFPSGKSGATREPFPGTRRVRSQSDFTFASCLVQL
jgi:hypothetical protein